MGMKLSKFCTLRTETPMRLKVDIGFLSSWRLPIMGIGGFTNEGCP